MICNVHEKNKCVLKWFKSHVIFIIEIKKNIYISKRFPSKKMTKSNMVTMVQVLSIDNF